MSHENTSQSNEWFTKNEYVNALRGLETRISARQRAVLKAHAESPGRVMSVFELAAAVGSETDNVTYSLYGRLGHMLANMLEPNTDPESDSNDQPIWTRYIGEDYRLEPGAPVSWIMHPELAEALGELGWARPTIEENPILDIELAEEELREEPFTVRQAIVLSRVGQGLFRERLLQYWNGCAVTGVKVVEALRASHIKPWSRSTNQERMDQFNGLLLVGTLDLLFDAGLISFDDSGSIMISDVLSTRDRMALGLSKDMRLRQIHPEHLLYLTYHSENIYRLAR
jgi:hypothetical protein